MHPEFGFRIAALNQKIDNDIITFWYDVIVILFWCHRISFLKFRWRFEFHVDSNTGSKLIKIFIQKFRNWKEPRLDFVRYKGLEQVTRVTKFLMGVSDELLLNVTNK